MKTRIVASWITLMAVAACSGAQMAEKAAAARPDGEGAVMVSVEGIKSGKGTVYASIYLTTEGFPEDKSLAYTYAFAAASEAKDGSMQLAFPSVPAGWFVVAVLHDTDGNEELSFNSMGIPRERYGFSQNPDAVFGPPAFDSAAVWLEPGETKRLVVRIE